MEPILEYLAMDAVKSSIAKPECAKAEAMFQVLRAQELKRFRSLFESTHVFCEQISKMEKENISLLQAVDVIEENVARSVKKIEELEKALLATDASLFQAAKNQKHPGAKQLEQRQSTESSNVVFFIKPLCETTNLEEMEALVRQLNFDGIQWGSSELIPLAFGISKLSISCVLDESKMTLENLIGMIERLEKHVQSVEVATYYRT